MIIETPPTGFESGVGSDSMHIYFFGNEFPSDDLSKLFRRISIHAKDRKHALLSQLLLETTCAVKEEIRQLPTALRQSVPPFDSILSWADDNQLREGSLGSSVDGVLLIVLQLASYVGYAEVQPGDVHNLQTTCLTGLGIGLLASTALSLSSQLAQVPTACANAARIAFRLGVHVQAVSALLESQKPSTGDRDSWAYVVHNVEEASVQCELDAVNSSKQGPQTSKIFVSAVSRTSVTISGPPSELKALFIKSKFFRDARLILLPVFGGLCHAPHIYGPKDIELVVSSSSISTRSQTDPRITPIYSTSTGLGYSASSSTRLYEEVVGELLMKPIYWDRAVDSVVDVARCALAAYVVLYNFGNSIPFHDLHAALMNSLPSIEVSCCNILATALQGTPNGTTPRGSAQAKLAIVGMSCRLPGGATNTEKFWKILESGLDVSRRIPADRFDIDTHYDPSGKQLNKSMTQYGCFIDEPGLFDAPFFNMSPREAHVADPQMRLSLVTAYEALERSGFVGNRTASTRLERIGTFYGQAADDYREVNQGQEVGTYYIPGGCRAFGPGRINYFFKFAGPSYSIDTACSSGLAAIEVACQSLWNGEVDMAVAGGVNVLTNPDGFTGLCNGHFLTKGHNACKTWDATADGYCRADGVGSLVIKRLGDAEADNDNILGVVLAAGTNHSAHAVSITHPHAGHQAYLSRQVLRQAGVDPLDVSYVELHGTGTQAGDREEMEGVVNVYAPLNRRRGKEQHLHIGAVKANVGHGESVAGTTALIKVLLMLEKNAIPPHIGIKTEINPTLPKDLDKRNVYIPKTMIPWTNGAGKKRIAAVNNFGAAGGNTTLILEEAHISTSAEPDHRQSHVVAISAKTRTSLTGNIERLIAYLDERPDTSIADLGYTTTARRYHHGFRVAAPVSDLNSLRKLLRSKLEQVDAVRSVEKSGPPQVAFTFTGQGASSKSMNLELYHDATIFREHIHYLDSIVQRQGFPSVLPALDGSFPKNHSHSPVVTQLSLVCVQIALIKYWASLGVTPDIVMGHSLGEYAAMHAAGVISAAGAIYLVGRRAQMLQEKCQIGSHVMVAVRASEVQVAKAAQGKPYTIACVNGPSDTVLSGSKEEMAAVTVVLEAAGYRCISLDVAFAFHSQQTDPILDDFEAIAKTGVTFNEPDLPVISPLLGKVVFDSKTLNAKYVRKATRDTVDFLAAMENARATSSVSNETVWVEIGPHSVCTSFVKAISPSTRLAVPSFRRDEDNWKTVADSMAALYLAGVPVRWHEFHQPFERRLRLLDLPTYAWNEKTYWIQYNGDWCLTKGNDSYALKSETTSTSPQIRLPAVGELQTTTVQSVVLEKVDTLSATITMQSDLMQPELLKAANGHRMNDCGVVTSSIHADIAYTLGQYVYRRLYPKAKVIDINVANLVVTKGLVASKKQTESQVFQVTASTSDITAGTLQLIWQKVDANSHTDEPFATATVSYESASQWLSTWTALAHLVQGRIDALEHLAASGKANRFSHSMAYTLFAQNLVDYAEKYRGMQSVVMHGLEGFAEVELSTKEGGSWTVPPYFIDSVAHLAGFIMNCSDKIDVRNNFCVTPGWESMRFAQPLVAGQQYRSYVKMIPTTEDPTVYFGDVYIMHESTIIGMVGGIQFRRYPRILLNRFFSPPEHAVAVKTAPGASSKPTTTVLTAAAPLTAKPHNTIADQSIMTSGLLPTTLPHANPSPKALKTSTPTPPAPTPTASSTLNTDSVANRAILLVANEAGLEFSDLEDDCSFADVGIDSLLSLVIAEKLRSNFDVKVGGSLFLDYPTVGDMRKWLEEYYG